jgi:hypothetical protein
MEPRRFGPIAVRAAAVAAASTGAFAVGALAIGALAVGAFAAGRLSVGSAHFRDVRIDRLTVGELIIEHASMPQRDTDLSA